MLLLASLNQLFQINRLFHGISLRTIAALSSFFASSEVNAHMASVIKLIPGPNGSPTLSPILTSPNNGLAPNAGLTPS